MSETGSSTQDTSPTSSPSSSLEDSLVQSPDGACSLNGSQLSSESPPSTQNVSTFANIGSSLFRPWYTIDPVVAGNSENWTDSSKELKAITLWNPDAINDSEEWTSTVKPAKEPLPLMILCMVMNNAKPNVKVKIDGVTFHCHMMVLECYSDYFVAFHNATNVLLPASRISPSAFMKAYNWMIIDDAPITRPQLLDLLMAANFLEIKELLNQCWLYIDNETFFVEHTAFNLYMQARPLRYESLNQLMLSRICRYFLQLVASEHFRNMDCEEVCSFLSLNTIGVNNEVEVYMSVVHWLNVNWEQRKVHTLQLMRRVRFSLMQPWFLIALIQGTECELVTRAAAEPSVKKLVDDSISYRTTQLFYSENKEEFVRFIKRYRLEIPVQRQWIYDSNCKYHHRTGCKNVQCFTYDDFRSYLHYLKSCDIEHWRKVRPERYLPENFKCCDQYVVNAVC